MKKIICIVNDVWPNSDMMWGFDLFQKRGYQVEVWKTGKLTIGTEIWEKAVLKAKTIRIDDWKSFYYKLLMQNMKNTKFLFFNKYNCFNLSKILIKLLGGRYYLINYSSIVCNNNLSALNVIKKKNISYMDIFPAKYNFLASKICVGGLNSNYELKKKNRNIIIHTNNYDYYLLNERDRKQVEDKDYILFLDQNLVDHKDLKNFKVKWINNKDKYFKELNLFLDQVEKYFKCKVLIAAHPTADYSNKSYFAGRKIVQGDTCNYVKHSKGIILFSSSAIDYAILYNKPIFFYYNDDLKRNYLYRDFQLPKRKYLKSNAINISHIKENEVFEDYMARMDNYISYRRDFIANKESKKLFFETVMEYL